MNVKHEQLKYPGEASLDSNIPYLEHIDEKDRLGLGELQELENRIAGLNLEDEDLSIETLTDHIVVKDIIWGKKKFKIFISEEKNEEEGGAFMSASTERDHDFDVYVYGLLSVNAIKQRIFHEIIEAYCASKIDSYFISKHPSASHEMTVAYEKAYPRY